MTNNDKNHVLYIGKDDTYASSLEKILNYRESDFQLHSISDVNQIGEFAQQENYQAFIIDSNVIRLDDSKAIDQVMSLSRNVPVVFVLEKGQESLGRYAMEKGAFDYLVKVDGAVSSIPFTIDRAIEFKPELEEVSIDFQIESNLEEQTSFFEINETGRFLTFDDQLSELLGLQKSEFYKSYLMDFVAEEDREKFYKWRASAKNQTKKFLIQTEIIHRDKGIIPVELQLEPYSKPESLFSGFRGYLKTFAGKPKGKVFEVYDKGADILPLFKEIYGLNDYLRQGFNQLFWMKVTEIPGKYFHFGNAMLFLYSTLLKKFQRELSIGRPFNQEEVDLRSDEFTLAEVEPLFAKGEFVRFVHQTVLNDEERFKIHGAASGELFQEKKWQHDEEWQIGDRIMLNLRDSKGTTHGFVVLEKPLANKMPNQSVLRQIELYTIFIASLFEGQNRFQNVETKYKQFKQVFTILETFSVESPLEGLLREIVWTIKFSLGFNLAALGILSKTTRLLHIKAVAVEGKEKANIISRLHFTLREITPWLKDKFRISHSYLISNRRSTFHLLKRIYGLPLSVEHNQKFWKYEDLLLIPIRMENQNIIGFLILDDPADRLRPTVELVQILEKIARLIAVTIQNKTTYTHLKSKICKLENVLAQRDSENNNANRIKKIFQRMSH